MICYLAVQKMAFLKLNLLINVLKNEEANKIFFRFGI